MRSLWLLTLLLSSSVASPLFGVEDVPLEVRDPQQPTGSPGGPSPTSPTGPGNASPVPPTVNPTLPGFPGGGPSLTLGQRPTQTLGSLPPSTARPNPPSGPVAACAGNTANTRSQWCQYSIDTDYTNVVPNTGVTREYWLTITDVVIAPDGFCKSITTDRQDSGPRL
jgi:hypothetical protein